MNANSETRLVVL